MEETLNRLAMVVRALNQIKVSGKTDLLNLGGAIDFVEQSIADIQRFNEEMRANADASAE